MNINIVALTGNLTRDPELRSTPGGTSVCDLGLAVNERFKQNDEWTERANFFAITVWGKQAENCAQYLAKGRPIAVQGRLRWESWEKDGEKRSAVKVVADQVQFLSDGKGSGGERFSPEPDVPADTNFGVPGAAATPDDDIPF